MMWEFSTDVLSMQQDKRNFSKLVGWGVGKLGVSELRDTCLQNTREDV